MCNAIRGLIVGLCSMAVFPALAQQGGSADPLFADDGILDVTLTAPLTTLVRERPSEEYIAGTFEYVDADGTVTALDVGLSGSTSRNRRSRGRCSTARTS